MERLKEALIEIFGQDFVEDGAAVSEYTQQQSIKKGCAPAFVVHVTDGEQIEKLVQYAGEHGVGLVPVSSKGAHRSGGSLVMTEGAVVVDMSALKKIIMINREFRMCIVEPGVTYGELQEALAKEGLLFNGALAPRPEKSVLASALETEPRINPNIQWNYTDPLRATMTVWGDGVRMGTGDASGKAPLEKQWASGRWQVSAPGPGLIDYSRLLAGSQGTMGIVQWASLKVAVLSDVEKMYAVGADTPENLIRLVNAMQGMRFGDELLLLDRAAFAALMSGSGRSYHELIAALPAWILLCGFCGRRLSPEMRVKVHTDTVSEEAGKLGLTMQESIAGISGDEMLRTVREPSKGLYWKDRVKGNSVDVSFITVLEKAPAFAEAAYQLAEQTGFGRENLGVYVQPQHQGTNCACDFILSFDGSCEKECAAADEFYRALSLLCSKMGAFYSRPYGMWSDLQYGKDPQYYHTMKDIQKIFDPKGIMNPGHLSVSGKEW